MDNLQSSDIKSAQLIGQPKIAGVIPIATIVCNCENKTILVGPAAYPIPCPYCKKTWLVSAKVSVEIRQVFLEESVAKN